MKACFLVSVALLGLAGCDDSDNETAVSDHDVNYYLNRPEARKSMLRDCENDPGRLRDTANCINAGEAERESFIQDLKESLKSQ